MSIYDRDEELRLRYGTDKHSIPELRRFYERMGSPAAGIPVIHVAGTNGKGSVCAFLERALMDMGLSTGVFISPHLESVRERIRLNGKMVPAGDFAAAEDKVNALSAAGDKADALSAAGDSLLPTYFEALFFTALSVFDVFKPDVMVLETGMGGRLDATNILTPEVSVITSISLDHMQYLGDTVSLIAREKAGIIKPGVPVVYDANSAEAEEVLLGTAKERGAKAYRSDPGEAVSSERWSFLSVPYMRENAALAFLAFGTFLDRMEEKGGRIGALSPENREGAFVSAVKRTYWPGRMDEVLPDVFFDGAHNADGIRAFSEAAAKLSKERGKRPVLLTGVVQDKDIRTMAETLSGVLSPARIYVTETGGSRSAPAEAYSAFFSEGGGGGSVPVRVYEAPEAALKAALRERGEDEILFAAGSLYLVGSLFTALGGIREGES